MRALLPLVAVAMLSACGRDQPPPLTGNLTDARGAHAGSFRGTGGGAGDYGNAAMPDEQAASNQAATEGALPDTTRKDADK